MWDGPIETLTLTENAQPALMAVSIAAIRVMEARGVRLRDKVAYVAGHSLGEYSALAAASSLSVGDAARLLRVRGRAMQDAVPVGTGAMAALLGMELDAAREIAAEAAEGEVCEVANDNGGGQVVVSGTKTAIERAVEIAKGKGARRAVLLPVSAPFHCALMKPAADRLAAELERVPVSAPRIPVVRNVDGGVTRTADEVKPFLVQQVASPVRWTDCVERLQREGAGAFLEVGPGRVLTGLLKRTLDGARGHPVEDPGSLDRAVAAVGGASA
jgi:[acyl-carrier-protein] S-malonyltransferase